MIFFIIPLVMLFVGVVAAVFRPVITMGVSVVAYGVVYALADAAGPGGLALLPHIWVCFVTFFASFVAFFARLVERKRNK